MLDKILEILDKFDTILYVLVPAIFGVYLNLRDRVKQKENEVKQSNLSKAKQAYKVWEHEESKIVIRKIKDLCNVYKDKGSMGLVEYLQLENGTMATSKICNMFVSCLAEDDRYGKVHKLISKLQRVPYSKLTGWLNPISDALKNPIDYYITEDISKADYSFADIVDAPEVKSCMIAPVYDPNEILLGICVFYYTGVDLNGDRETEIPLITKLRASVEAVLLEYHLNREKQKAKLGLKDGDLDD